MPTSSCRAPAGARDAGFGVPPSTTAGRAPTRSVNRNRKHRRGLDVPADCAVASSQERRRGGQLPSRSARAPGRRRLPDRPLPFANWCTTRVRGGSDRPGSPAWAARRGWMRSRSTRWLAAEVRRCPRTLAGRIYDREPPALLAVARHRAVTPSVISLSASATGALANVRQNAPRSGEYALRWGNAHRTSSPQLLAG